MSVLAARFPAIDSVLGWFRDRFRLGRDVEALYRNRYEKGLCYNCGERPYLPDNDYECCDCAEERQAHWGSPPLFRP